MAPLKKFKSNYAPVDITLAVAKKASSRIFQPFRAIGHVTSDVPFCVQARGSEFFVTVAVGHCFQIYDCAHLQLKFVSEYTKDTIRYLAATGDYTFAACGSTVVKFYRAKIQGELKADGDDNASILDMLLFGDHLVVVYENNIVRIWDWNNGEIHEELEFSSQTFSVARVFHPSTYLNKVLFLGQDGRMQLWNLRTR